MSEAKQSKQKTLKEVLEHMKELSNQSYEVYFKSGRPVIEVWCPGGNSPGGEVPAVWLCSFQ